MARQQAKRDPNYQPVIQGETDNAARDTRSLKVDPTTDRLKVNTTVTGAVDLLPPSSIVNGQKTVTSAGTAEALGSTTSVKSVSIKALSTNAGNVYVGDSGVDSSNGYILYPSDAVDLDITDIATIYLDVDTNGEGVSFIGLV